MSPGPFSKQICLWSKLSHSLTAMQITPGEVMPIYSDREFDYVLKKHADQLVVVCASSTDCKPCRSFEPVYDVSDSSLCTGLS